MRRSRTQRWRIICAPFPPTFGLRGRARLDPLAGARRRLTRALDFLRARAEQQTLTPAARWLVDNARMLEEAMTTLRGELRGAPALPARRGVPCVARFAAAWLSHTDGRADEESLRRAARAWQAARLLDEKELRLLPAAVRRALLLLLSSLAAQCERAERETRAGGDGGRYRRGTPVRRILGKAGVFVAGTGGPPGF